MPAGGAAFDRKPDTDPSYEHFSTDELEGSLIAAKEVTLHFSVSLSHTCTNK